MALGDAAPLYRDPSEAGVAREGGSATILTFFAEALSDTAVTRQMAADLIKSTLAQVGSTFFEVERSGQEIAAFADAIRTCLRLCKKPRRQDESIPSRLGWSVGPVL